MNWLDRYLALERVMMDLDDSNESAIGNSIRDTLDLVWPHLTEDDIVYLKSRGMIKDASDLDKLSVKKAFLDAGWSYSHSIAADGNICSDHSCFRCRLASILFEVENKED